MFNWRNLRNNMVITLCFIVLLTVTSVQAWTLQDGPTPAAPATDETAGFEATESEQARALAMWGREARMAAQPMPLPQVTAPLDAVVAAAAEQTGEPGFAPGGFPDPNADLIAQQEFPEEWALLAETANSLAAEQLELSTAETVEPSAPDGTSEEFTRYAVNYFSQMHRYWPYKAVGKLYFTDHGASKYCTATVISPNNIIVTAAHCVYDTKNNHNHYHNNFVFVPAERNFDGPYGSFAGAQAKVLDAWKNLSGSSMQTGWIKHDVGLIRLSNNSSGRAVTYYTGYIGRSWNLDYTQLIHAIGYPSNITAGPDGIVYSYMCVAETFFVYPLFDVLGMGCDMKDGASGGPYLRKFEPYAKARVNSVVSAGFVELNNVYGPRFTSSNIVALCIFMVC